MPEDFLAYVGDPDLHDGEVIAARRDGSDAQAQVRGASGRRYVASFSGVRAVTENQAEGMRIYALTEIRAPAPLRRFVFANWDEPHDAVLEVVALELQCSPLPR